MWESPEPHATLNVPVDEHAVITVRRPGNPDGPRMVMSHGNGLAIDLYSSNRSSWQDIAGATSSS